MPTTRARLHTTAASQEFMEENRMTRASYSRYSQDLAPSDFLLFDDVKRCPRQLFETPDELLLDIEVFQKATLNEVFFDWMQRLEQCIATNGRTGMIHSLHIV
jgi:hypothetical protein